MTTGVGDQPLDLASSNRSMLSYARSADNRELQKLIGQHAQSLYYFLLRQSDAELATELCQQSWLRVIEARQQFQAQSSFKTWLFSIARNLLLDEWRRRQRWTDLDDQDIEATEQPELWLQAHQQQLAFQQLLEALPALQREALLLQLEGFSLAEISQICGTGQETIKSRLRYARAAMATALGVDS